MLGLRPASVTESHVERVQGGDHCRTLRTTEVAGLGRGVAGKAATPRAVWRDAKAGKRKDAHGWSREQPARPPGMIPSGAWENHLAEVVR